MFELTNQDRKLLKSIGMTGNGNDLKHLLQRMQIHVIDVSNIKSDEAIQVAARKIVKSLIQELIEGMSRKEQPSGFEEGIDDYES